MGDGSFARTLLIRSLTLTFTAHTHTYTHTHIYIHIRAPTLQAHANGFHRCAKLLIRYGAQSGADIVDAEEGLPGDGGGPETHYSQHQTEHYGNLEEQQAGEWQQVWDDKLGEWTWVFKPQDSAHDVTVHSPSKAAHAAKAAAAEAAAAAAREAAAAMEAASGMGGVIAEEEEGGEEEDEVGTMAPLRSVAALSGETQDGQTPLVSPSSQLDTLKKTFTREKRARRKTEDTERLRQQSQTLLKLRARRASKIALKGATPVTLRKLSPETAVPEDEVVEGKT